jgi:two-component system sensor histidine kinase RegB
MTDQPAEEAHRTGRSVRLDTLVRLRWLAVIGQTTAVLVVYFGLDYELPIWACLAVIALAAGYADQSALTRALRRIGC